MPSEAGNRFRPGNDPQAQRFLTHHDVSGYPACQVLPLPLGKKHCQKLNEGGLGKAETLAPGAHTVAAGKSMRCGAPKAGVPGGSRLA